MPSYHLAQLNIANSKFAIDDPAMADFVNNLDVINTLAEQSPGFIWRYKADILSASKNSLFDENVIVNMSVWNNLESLHYYVYRSAHTKIMSRRKEWFEHVREAYSVLWWIHKDHIPSAFEAKQRLNLLIKKGPTAEAFTFKKAYSAPDSNPESELSGGKN